MSFNRYALAAVLAAVGAVRLAAADVQAGTLQLDPAQTHIEFRLKGTLHSTRGTFKLTRGIINADPRTGAADGVLEIDAASGDSGLGARDNRMKDDILEAAKYPQITFAPTHIDVRIEPAGAFRATLQGVMTVHGAAHDMTIASEGHLSGDEVVATCHFSIPYVEWGMTDPSLPLLSVAKQVEIEVATAGHVVWTGAAADQ